MVPMLALLVVVAGQAAPSRSVEAKAPGANKAPADPVAVVIADDDLPIHRQVVTGLVVESRATVVEFNLGGDASVGEAVMKRALAESPTVIIAVGPRSLVSAMTATTTVPIVYCLVPRLEAYDLSADNVAGVKLEPSAKSQLELLSVVAPKMSRVAVVLNPEESKDALDDVIRAARDAKLEVVTVPVKRPEDTASALSGAKFDALLMVPDPTALNLTSFSATSDHARANKIPFLALNARFVERGALLAYVIDYPRLGRQVGRVSNAILDGETTAAKLGVIDTEGLDVAYGLSTATAVGMPESVPGALLEFSAERGVSVKAIR